MVQRWVLAGLLVAVACISGCRKERPTKEELLQNMSPEMRRVLDPPADAPLQSTPMVVAGIEDPEMVTAEAAGLLPDDEVIGILVDGQPLAYPLRRLSGMMDHVVNDVLSVSGNGRQPYSVAYCDMTDCIRVWVPVDESVDESLKIGTLGVIEGGLAVTVGNEHYKQTDPIPGLKEIEFERLDWSDWLAKHPNTLIYRGSNRIETTAPEADAP